MPWREWTPMDERLQFLGAVQAGEEPFAALCRRFGISRKTGYKWRQRYQTEGVAGLAERSRAPKTHPQAISPAVAEVLVATRVAHPTWGPAKLLAWLAPRYPQLELPVASTVGDLLRGRGLTVPHRRRPRAPVRSTPLTAMDDGNVVWAADFKGHFPTGDGQLCYPFTLSDGFSRYLLRCQALSQPDGAQVRPVMEAAFREYGLPQVIRTDNGPPFGAASQTGLTRLAVWWITLGIVPERIDAGQPGQNGRHERLHRTLKAETATPPAATRDAQQRAFLRFQQEYNHERPHEALGQIPPGQLYTPSARSYPDRIEPFAYPEADYVRRVRHNGELYWRKQYLYLSQALAGELVGLTARTDGADGQWTITFGPLELGILDEGRGTLVVPPGTGRGRSPASDETG